METNNAIDAAADLVRRDVSIPGLGLMLDPSRLLTELGEKLDCSQVEDIKLAYIRYKPGMNCLARYELSADGHSIIAYAKAYGQDATGKISKSAERPVIDGKLGPGRVVLEDHQIIFSTFPNDAKLASLRCLNDVEFRQRLFRRLFGQDSAWYDSRPTRALNYKPERRYVARFTRSDGKSALLKFYSRSGYAKARIISRKFGRSGERFYPETIGRSKKHAVVAYHWQPGTTLRQLSNEGELKLDSIAAAAGALAEFHASERGGLIPIEAGEQAARLSAHAEQAGILLPQLRQRANRVAQQLTEWRAGLEPVLLPVHGDFYDKQVIVCDGNARLIDLDAARMDDPLLDLGSYIAHLERQAVSYAMAGIDVETHRKTLIRAYEQAAGHACMAQLNKYIALGLFDLIHQPFRDWAQDWPAQTEQLLERVEALMVV